MPSKLAVTTNLSNENFAAMLDKAIARSRVPQLELKAEPEHDAPAANR